MAVLSAFLLWPLAALQLTPRTITHLYRTLTKEKPAHDRRLLGSARRA